MRRPTQWVNLPRLDNSTDSLPGRVFSLILTPLGPRKATVDLWRVLPVAQAQFLISGCSQWNALPFTGLYIEIFSHEATSLTLQIQRRL